jgi:hypothetical protein
VVQEFNARTIWEFPWFGDGRFYVVGRWAGRQDAGLYGRRDACRYNEAGGPSNAERNLTELGLEFCSGILQLWSWSQNIIPIYERE